MPSTVDTAYRTWPAADLAALRSSTLIQIANIQGTGQTHNMNGRSVGQADFQKLTETLNSVNAAIDWQANLSNRGNKGYARRLTNYNTGCWE